MHLQFRTPEQTGDCQLARAALKPATCLADFKSQVSGEVSGLAGLRGLGLLVQGF